MDDLVERLRAKVDGGRRTLGGGTVSHDGKFSMWGFEPIMVARNPDGLEAIARITALEASLAEAEGRVIAEVVAWLRGEHREIRAMRSPVRNLDEVATALETGEWKK